MFDIGIIEFAVIVVALALTVMGIRQLIKRR